KAQRAPPLPTARPVRRHRDGLRPLGRGHDGAVQGQGAVSDTTARVADPGRSRARSAGRAELGILAASLAVLGVTLVLAWSGAIGEALYDGGEHVATPASSHGLLDTTRVIDRNAKYLAARTGLAAGGYRDLLRRLSAREDGLRLLERRTRAALGNVNRL